MKMTIKEARETILNAPEATRAAGAIHAIPDESAPALLRIMEGDGHAWGGKRGVRAKGGVTVQKTNRVMKAVTVMALHRNRHLSALPKS